MSNIIITHLLLCFVRKFTLQHLWNVFFFFLLFVTDKIFASLTLTSIADLLNIIAIDPLKGSEMPLII